MGTTEGTPNGPRRTARGRAGYLIDAIKTRPQIARAELPRHARTHHHSIMLQYTEVFHLRFQRTLPSFVSSRIIPRSASSFRMRSAFAKSLFFRATSLS